VQTLTLLHAPLPAVGSWPWQQALLQALPYAKRLELEGRESADREAALAGLALLLAGARRLRCSVVDVRRLVFAPGRKPRCVDGPWFSISHTRGHVACVLSESVDPGVDIERVAAGAPAAEVASLRRWTATEAALKAAGLGLRESGRVRLDPGLRHAAIEGQRYALHAPRVADGVVCHVAAVELPASCASAAIDLGGREVSAAVEGSLGLPVQAD
jgi:phosphopantetheinyl transferase